MRQEASSAIVGDRGPVVAISFRFVMCLLVTGLLNVLPANSRIGFGSEAHPVVHNRQLVHLTASKPPPQIQQLRNT